MSRRNKTSIAAADTKQPVAPVETKEPVETPEATEVVEAPAEAEVAPEAPAVEVVEEIPAVQPVAPYDLVRGDNPVVQTVDEVPFAQGVDAEVFKAPEAPALPQPVQVIIESFGSYVIKTDPSKGTVDPDRLKVLQRELYYNILRMWRIEPKYLTAVLTAVDDIWTANIKGALAPTITWRYGSEINFPNAGASNLVCLSLAFFEAMAACKDTRAVTKIYRIDDLCNLIKPESAEALREYLN